MKDKSHIDKSKLDKVPSGHPFEYMDIVSEDLPMSEHTIDGRRFKNEVQNGEYKNVKIDDENPGNRILYRKLK